MHSGLLCVMDWKITIRFSGYVTWCFDYFYSVIAKTAPEAKRVVLAGLSNIYSDYIATPEEYQVLISPYIYFMQTLILVTKIYRGT